MRRILAVMLVPISLVLTAQANAQRMAPLSKQTAETLAEDYAQREGHRIWRLRAMDALVTCNRQDRYQFACQMTDRLYYSGYGTTPTEVEATLDVRKTKPNHVRYWLAQDWEVLPPRHETEISPAEAEKLLSELEH